MMTAYIRYEILSNGNLALLASNQARHDYAEMLRERGSDAVWWDIMAPFRDNGQIFPIEPEWIGALTSAPIISDFHTITDDGENEVGDTVWWFPNYAIIDPMERLVHRGRVEFVKAE